MPAVLKSVSATPNSSMRANECLMPELRCVVSSARLLDDNAVITVCNSPAVRPVSPMSTLVRPCRRSSIAVISVTLTRSQRREPEL